MSVSAAHRALALIRTGDGINESLQTVSQTAVRSVHNGLTGTHRHQMLSDIEIQQFGVNRGAEGRSLGRGGGHYQGLVGHDHQIILVCCHGHHSRPDALGIIDAFQQWIGAGAAGHDKDGVFAARSLETL